MEEKKERFGRKGPNGWQTGAWLSRNKKNTLWVEIGRGGSLPLCLRNSTTTSLLLQIVVIFSILYPKLQTNLTLQPSLQTYPRIISLDNDCRLGIALLTSHGFSSFRLCFTSDSEPVLSIGEPMFTLLPARFFQRIGRGGELWPPFRTGSGRERCPISHHHFRIGEPRVEDDVCGSSRDSEPPNVVLSNDDVFFFQGRIFGKSVVLRIRSKRSFFFFFFST